ncbi:hypothetical protein CIK73_06050 [Brachybacterium alimentarium]|uniref:helix-turn-helix transcriptional regulator n=1 Tax=Brachybacterium alimentarium TaxID=47845 RepID=UPI000DF1E77F|nr:hypothetical protein [Brachybacterium alimentarium]RCS69482.1 hypothetical protein CIK73_06050 [Brachybacterium alimentarium]
MIDDRNQALPETFSLSARTTFSPPGGERLLTRHEAADVLGLAAGTLANWHSAGKGPRSVVVGVRTRRYRLSDLTSYMESLSSSDGVR